MALLIVGADGTVLSASEAYLVDVQDTDAFLDQIDDRDRATHAVTHGLRCDSLAVTVPPAAPLNLSSVRQQARMMVGKHVAGMRQSGRHADPSAASDARRRAAERDEHGQPAAPDCR